MSPADERTEPATPAEPGGAQRDDAAALDGGAEPDEAPGGAQGLVANAKRARESALVRLEQERQRHVVVAVAFLIADRGRAAAASVLAGALAFRLFLVLLPLTLVMVVGLGFLKTSGTQPSEALKQFGVKGALASTINHSANFNDPG